MGEVTNQYSAEEIIEKYHKHIHNYNSIIEELKNIMKQMTKYSLEGDVNE